MYLYHLPDNIKLPEHSTNTSLRLLAPGCSASSSAYDCDVSIGRLAQIAAAVPGECVAVGLEEAQGLIVEVGR